MKRTAGILLLSSLLLGLASCSNKPSIKVKSLVTMAILACSSDEAQSDRLVCVDTPSSVFSVRPFDSGISLKIYYPADQIPDLEKIEEEFTTTMSYYSAVFDRHYSYRVRSSLEEDFVPLVNVRTVNQSIANLDQGNEESTVLRLPAMLYEALKQAYDFTINSNLKYNFAVGALSTLWDKYITLSGVDVGSLTDEQKQLVKDKQVVVYNDPTEEELAKAMAATPTLSDLPRIFQFEEATSSLKLSKIKENSSDIHLEITLGGYGKGKAVEAFASSNPDLALLLDGGTSSIKAQNSKANDSPWKIKITNPIYQEEIRWANTFLGFPIPLNNLNSEEFFYQQKGDFNLSTSGYYNNYFYAITDSGVELRHHIIDSTIGYSRQFFDSTSVFIDDSALGDMYSTALMNCSSLDEAETLRKNLDSIYNIETWAFYTTHERLSKNSVTASIPKGHSKSFSMMPSGDLQYSTITKIINF